MLQKKIEGCLIGSAIGDSMGLPMEALSKNRQKKLFPNQLKQQLWGGKGYASDDTEHLVMVVEAWLTEDELEGYQQRLATKLKRWFLALPAGIGAATLKACLKLCLGMSPKKSGVFSAGNGPAMRTSILGIIYSDDLVQLTEAVQKTTEITHTDPRALDGALCIALLAALVTQHGEVRFEQLDKALASLLSKPEESAIYKAIKDAKNAFQQGKSFDEYLMMNGCEKGVSGFVMHTVPAVVYCFFSFQGNFEKGIQAMIRAGGDTDTTAAILGSLLGIQGSGKDIPQDWIEHYHDKPMTIDYVRTLSKLISEKVEQREQVDLPAFPTYTQFLKRNLRFMCIVLLLGLRRLFPPYR